MHRKPSVLRAPAAVLVALAVALAVAVAAHAQVGPPVVPGFPNVPQTVGLLSGLHAPEQGRTAIIAYHEGVLFTVPELPASQPGADFQVRTWDLSDPTAPQELAQWGISPMPIQAHGYLKDGPRLVVGPNWPPGGEWSFQRDGGGTMQRTTSPLADCIGVRGCLVQPWFVGQSYWSYDAVGGLSTIERPPGNVLATWDHLGTTGVVGHPFLLGDLLIYASDQSRTGVATYDVSDPTNPVLLDVLTDGGPGGYWPELWGGDGKLYVVFPYRTGGNGMRVVEATDPADLRFVADVPLPGDEAMYAQFQDHYAFIGSHKVDMRTFQSVLDLDGANVVRTSDGGTGIDTSQFALPLGNLLVTGGVGPNEGMAIWAHQAAPDTTGPAVGFHVPRAGRTGYPVDAPISLLIHETIESFTLLNGVTFLVRPLGGAPIAGSLTWSFDDVLTFTPAVPLLPDTTYEVVIPEGGIKDAAGNGAQGYAFTFATGAAVAGNAPPTVTALTASAYPAAAGAPLTLAATASDPEAGALEYRFDFGDGSAKTAWSATPEATASYAAPGHYRAVVQVRDTAGALASATRTVTVLTPPAGPFATWSSPIACDADGRRVWSVDPDNDALAAVDADGLVRDLAVAVCDDPRGVARAGTGELWVACHDDDTVRVVSPSGAVLATLATGYGSAPAGVVVSPAGDVVYVALEGAGEVRRYDAVSRAATGTLAVGPWPRALAVTGDGGRLLVSRFLSPRDHAEIYDVDTATWTLAGTLVVDKLGGESNRDSTATGRGVLNYLVGLAVSPDGGSLWVVGTKPNAERGLLFGPDLDQDNTQRNALVEIDLATGAVERTLDLDNSDSASAVAFSPLGDYLLVTLQGNDELLVLDALGLDGTAGLGAQVTRLATGAAPQGLCIDPPTGRTFVEDFLGRTVTVLATAELFAAGDLAVGATTVTTVDAEALAPDVLAGKRIFYGAGDSRMSAEGYLSCASCHLDGGQDGRVWDFTGRGEGLRNTASLRGRAGLGHGNVHWSGNFDEIQDFENDVRQAFGGVGFLDDGDFAATGDPLGPVKAGLSPDLDALAAYVASLGAETVPRSPFREADGSATPAGAAGRVVFASLGCGACHGGPAFTDSTVGAATLHDVGTLRTTSGGRLGGPLAGIDTPTLRGVWATAPYLHDGSAATLEDVFRVAGGTVVPAESGTPGGGATVIDQYVDLNLDDTVHGRALVRLAGPGQSLTFHGVDGGPGGVGALELRYSDNQDLVLTVRVNGVAHQADLPFVGNVPPWWPRKWRASRVDGIAWTPGPTNTVVLEYEAATMYPEINLDEIVVATAAELAAAAPHRQVLDLPAGDRAALLAYLREVDGSADSGSLDLVFADGFESGDTSAW